MNIYDTDIKSLELFTEIWYCKMLLSTRNEVQQETPMAFYNIIISYRDRVFPNLPSALQILLTIAAIQAVSSPLVN